VVRVNPLDAAEAAQVANGALVLSFLQPAGAVEALRALAGRQATAVSFDLLPRISRAQSMDALSSQSTVSGYRSGLAAAEHLAKFFPMFMTSRAPSPGQGAGDGCRRRGLQAIATARRLGAVVRAYDVRAAAKEEAESLGATFVDLGSPPRGPAATPGSSPRRSWPPARGLAAEVASSDVVITTAAVPAARPRCC